MSALLAITFAVASVVYATHKRLYIPAAVALLCVGMVLGAATPAIEPSSTGAFENELWTWAHVNPDFLQSIPLPLLVFEAAFNTDTHALLRRIRAVLLLAVFGVLLTAFFIALGPRFLFVASKASWRHALLLGSMLAPTDPIAVVAVLREAGADDTLQGLIEGEALLNDGVAIILYTLLQLNNDSPTFVVESTLRLACVAIALGVVTGLTCSWLAGARVTYRPFVAVTLIGSCSHL
jgi:NhaP-type Na+/H+ or K+/H+ antiporter